MKLQKLIFQKDKYRRLFNLAGPLVLSSSGLVLMQFTDAIFLAKYSPSAIAASGTGGMVSWLVSSLIVGTVCYTGTITANNIGAGREERIGSINWQGMYLGLLGGGITALLSLGTGFFFQHIGHEHELSLLESEYLRILLLGGVLHFVQCALSGFFSGRGDNTRLMLAQLSGQFGNGVLDYLWIFGKCGFPKMGVAGAAWATVLSNIFPMVIMCFWFFSKENDERYRSRRDWRPDFKDIRQILRFGLPSGFQCCVDAGIWTLFLIVIGRIGTVELAATNIAFRLNNLSFIPVLGVARAMSTLVGQCHGEKDHEGSIAYMGHGLVVCQSWMTFIAISYALFAKQYFMIFQSDGGNDAIQYADVMKTGVPLLRFVAVYTLADSINITLSTGLQAVGDTKWTFKIMAFFSVIFASSVLLGDYFHWGLMAVWTFATIFIVSLAPVWFFRIRNGAWKDINVAS